MTRTHMTNINNNDIYAKPVTDGDPDMVVIAVPQDHDQTRGEATSVSDGTNKRDLGVRSGKTHLPGHEPSRNLKLDLSDIGNKATKSAIPVELPPKVDVETKEMDAEAIVEVVPTVDDNVADKVDTESMEEQVEETKPVIDQSKLVELPSRVEAEDEKTEEEVHDDISIDEAVDGAEEKSDGEVEEDDRVPREEYERLEQRIEILTKDYEMLKKRQIEALKEKELTANMNLAKILLPIFDDLDKAIEYSSQNDLDTMDVAGIINIRKKMIGALANEGLNIIDPLGQPFDMNEHQAIEREQIEGEADMVTKVYQVGYKLHDKVIRPALVAVSY